MQHVSALLCHGCTGKGRERYKVSSVVQGGKTPFQRLDSLSFVLLTTTTAKFVLAGRREKFSISTDFILVLFIPTDDELMSMED